MTAAAADQGRRQGMRALIRRNASTIVFDLVLPLGLYYGLRAAGVSQWWALLAGILASIPRIALGIWRARRLDLMAVFTISVMAFSLVIGVLTDSPRALAIREGWVGALLGLFGLGMVISVLVRRPVLMTLGRTVAVAKVGEAGAQVWERRWREDAGFRHGLRVISVVWGARVVRQFGGRHCADLPAADRLDHYRDQCAVLCDSGRVARIPRVLHEEAWSSCLTST